MYRLHRWLRPRRLTHFNSVVFHMETKHLFCSSKQMTGFCLKRSTERKQDIGPYFLYVTSQYLFLLPLSKSRLSYLTRAGSIIWIISRSNYRGIYKNSCSYTTKILLWRPNHFEKRLNTNTLFCWYLHLLTRIEVATGGFLLKRVFWQISQNRRKTLVSKPLF